MAFDTRSEIRLCTYTHRSALVPRLEHELESVSAPIGPELLAAQHLGIFKAQPCSIG